MTMASLLDLPADILVILASRIASEKALSRLSRTCHSLHHLLTRQLYLDNQKYHDNTALQCAAKTDNMDTVRQALNSGAQLDEYRLLQLAVEYKNAQILAFFLSISPVLVNQIDILAKDTGSTLLFQAAIRGSLEVVRELLKYGANILRPCDGRIQGLSPDGDGNQPDGELEVESKPNPFLIAAAGGHTDLVEEFLNSSSPSSSPSSSSPSSNVTSSMASTTISSYIDQVSEIGFDNSNDDNIVSSSANKAPISAYTGWLATCLASTHGHTDTIRSLLDFGDGYGYSGWASPTILYQALQNGLDDLVDLLLTRGVSNAHRNSQNGYGAIHFAAANSGDGLLIKRLLRLNIPVDVRSDHNVTALMLAAGSGHVEAVQVLLEHGADIEAYDNFGFTSIHLAARTNHANVLPLLIKSGADIHRISENGYSPVHLAIMLSCLDVADILYDHGADIFAPGSNEDGYTPLQNACCEGGSVEAIQWMMDRGGDVNATTTDGMGWSPLLIAVDNNFEAAVHLLLDKGADVDAAMLPNKWTALHLAANLGQVGIVERLIASGADITARTSIGAIPVHYAASQGFPDVVGLFYSMSGMDRSASDNNGRSALFYAAMGGKINTICTIVSTKAPGEYDLSSNTPNVYGVLPIFVAAINGFVDVVKLLLKIDPSSVYHKDNIGRNLLWYASSGPDSQVLHLIQQQYTGVLDLVPEPSTASFVLASDVSSCCRCSVCGFSGHASFLRQCPSCDLGDFIICGECYSMGARCRGGNLHVLMAAACKLNGG